MQTIYIYGLWDPRNLELRYIGKTVDIERRLRNHINDAKKGIHTYKHHWIRQLLEEGLEPSIDVLEECDSDNWEDSEKKWIAESKDHGLNLTNLTDGGDGLNNHTFSDEHKKNLSKALEGNQNPLGNKHTEESKQRMSKAQKGLKKSDEHRRKLSIIAKNRPKRKLSKEHKEALRQANLGRVYSEETKEKIRQASLGNQNAVGAVRTKEQRKKISDALKGNTPWNKGRPRSAATKEKLRQANSGRKLSEEHKAKISRGIQKRMENLEYKKNQREGLKRYWEERREREKQERELNDR